MGKLTKKKIKNCKSVNKKLNKISKLNKNISDLDQDYSDNSEFELECEKEIKNVKPKTSRNEFKFELNPNFKNSVPNDNLIFYLYAEKNNLVKSFGVNLKNLNLWRDVHSLKLQKYEPEIIGKTLIFRSKKIVCISSI